MLFMCKCSGDESEHSRTVLRRDIVHAGNIWTISIDFVLSTYTFRAFMCWEGCVECRVLVYFAKITHSTNNDTKLKELETGACRNEEPRVLKSTRLPVSYDRRLIFQNISKYIDNMLPADCVLLYVLLCLILFCPVAISMYVLEFMQYTLIDWLIDLLMIFIAKWIVYYSLIRVNNVFGRGLYTAVLYCTII
jgi:hypothetical protein